MNPLVIRRFEFDVLRIGEDGFTENHFNRLVEFNDQHNNQFFIIGNRRVIFRNHVGVIQIGVLTIEILPKLDRQSTNNATMQNVLIKMLHRVDLLPMESTGMASLKKTPGSVFELYLRIFIAEVHRIINQGIPRRYSKIKNNERFLRGRFLVFEQIKHNLIKKDFFYTEHQVFSIDHPLNQILKKALCLISNFQYDFNNEIKECLSFFEHVSDFDSHAIDFARLKYNRNTECYRNAISIAELIISNFQPDLRFGQLNIMALLFDMNLLFERYVAIEMVRHSKDYEDDITIKAQYSKIFWHQNEGSSQKTIRPDIVVDIGGNRFVLDTKWKLLPEGKPADEDLRQMYVYSLQLNAKQVILVYPSLSEDIECISGLFSETYYHPSRSVSLWKVPLLQGNELNTKLGNTILSKLYSIM